MVTRNNARIAKKMASTQRSINSMLMARPPNKQSSQTPQSPKLPASQTPGGGYGKPGENIPQHQLQPQRPRPKKQNIPLSLKLLKGGNRK